MKKIIYVVLILILFSFGCSKKDDTGQRTTGQDTTRDTATNTTTESADVRMMYFNVPPHVFYNAQTGEISGAVYELIQNHIAPEMGITFKWEADPWPIPRQLVTLENEDGYASALISKIPAFMEQMEYSQEPYFLSQSALVVQKENPLGKVAVIDDILELTIGFTSGPQSRDFLSPFMRDERLKWDSVNDSNFMLLNCEKVVKKRIDAAYAPDKAGLLAVVKAGGFDTELKLLDLPEQKSRFHVAFSKGTVELVAKYNAAFKKIDASRVYFQILAKYLDVSKL